jgi:hypothetical protein
MFKIENNNVIYIFYINFKNNKIHKKLRYTLSSGCRWEQMQVLGDHDRIEMPIIGWPLYRTIAVRSIPKWLKKYKRKKINFKNKTKKNNVASLLRAIKCYPSFLFIYLFYFHDINKRMNLSDSVSNQPIWLAFCRL